MDFGKQHRTEQIVRQNAPLFFNPGQTFRTTDNTNISNDTSK